MLKWPSIRSREKYAEGDNEKFLGDVQGRDHKQQYAPVVYNSDKSADLAIV